MQNNHVKVNICALLANDAFNLPQWIHHHFYFGFAGFDLYLNRTTDNTLDILKKLQTYYPNIRHRNTDWVDKHFSYAPPFNFMQYSHHLYNYLNIDSEYDYVLNLDGDEFWMPRNCHDTVQQCLQRFAYPDCIVHHWFTIGGYPEYINPVLAIKHFCGWNGPWTKCIVRSGLDVKEMKIHMPSFNYCERIVLGDGTDHRYNREKDICLHRSQYIRSIRDYFILHDGVRTPIKNFAKYTLGNPATQKCKSIASMPQWRTPYRHMERKPWLVNFDNAIQPDYYAKYRKMVDDLDLYEDMRKARVNDCLYALSFLRQIHNEPDAPFAQQFTKALGKAGDWHEKIFQTLIGLDESYAQFGHVALATPQALVGNDTGAAIRNLYAATQLYPYDAAPDYTPLFMRRLLEVLTRAGDFARAWQIVEDKALSSNRAFGNAWAMRIIAAAYEKRKYYADALALYRKMESSRDKEIWQAIDRLEKICADLNRK